MTIVERAAHSTFHQLALAATPYLVALVAALSGTLYNHLSVRLDAAEASIDAMAARIERIDTRTLLGREERLETTKSIVARFDQTTIAIEKIDDALAALQAEVSALRATIEESRRSTAPGK